MNIALIPARAGSKRFPNKNLALLENKPLIAYSIESALKTNEFTEVIVSTDDRKIADVAKEYGASVPMLRPSDISGDLSCDIEWLNHAINHMISSPLSLVKNLAILRPTNPLRSSNSIINGLRALNSNKWADSLRAMELTSKHPGKMWVIDLNGKATPYLMQKNGLVPTHDSPLQTLERLWVQNASLEIVRLKAVLETGTISGDAVLSFEMPGLEGYDINSIEDFNYLQFLVSKDPRLLETSSEVN